MAENRLQLFSEFHCRIHPEPIEFLPDKITSAEASRLISVRTGLRLLGSSSRLDIVHSVLKQLPNGVNTVNEEVHNHGEIPFSHPILLHSAETALTPPNPVGHNSNRD